MHLLVEEVSRCFNWESLAAGLNHQGRFIPHKAGFSTDSTDAHAEFLLKDAGGSEVFKVQLRLSLREVGVCINLRPLPGEHSTFRKKVEKYFGRQALNRVGAVGVGVYFKPFADMNGSRAKDVYFNFSDLTIPKHLNHTCWLGVQPSLKTIARSNRLINPANPIGSLRGILDFPVLEIGHNPLGVILRASALAHHNGVRPSS